MKPASYKSKKSHYVDGRDLMSATELPIEPFAECKHLASDSMECYAHLRVRSCPLHI